MANQAHLEILAQGVSAWNEWRRQVTMVTPDLSGADLSEMQLDRIDLLSVNLQNATLRGTSICDALLRMAKVDGADLSGSKMVRSDCKGATFCKSILDIANMSDAELSWCIFSDASFRETDLSGARLRNTVFHRAKLVGANLTFALLDNVDLTDATVHACRVYATAVWDMKTEGADQKGLIVTPGNAAEITVDNLELAQFVHLILNNKKVRSAIDTITTKLVLILGRFTPKRKKVLEAIRERLTQLNYLPVVFDFEKPANRDVTETVSTLAHMARFVIADLTDARSIPQELGRIVPFLPSVPVQPIILASQNEYGVYETFPRYPWVLKIVPYQNQKLLLKNLQISVVEPAEAAARTQVRYGASS
jgi:hypothetical protein